MLEFVRHRCALLLEQSRVELHVQVAVLQGVVGVAVCADELKVVEHLRVRVRVYELGLGLGLG